MKFLKGEHDVLKKIFQQAYFEKESIPVSHRWQHGVMHHIRNLTPRESGISFFIRFEHFVWKLTPALCLMILILAVLLYHIEIILDRYD